MENKQSSIEWLMEQLKEYDFSEEDDTYVIKIQSWVLTEKHEQAKAMHKEEIEKAWSNGYDEDDRATSSPLKYYNETYGGNK